MRARMNYGDRSDTAYAAIFSCDITLFLEVYALSGCRQQALQEIY